MPSPDHRSDGRLTDIAICIAQMERGAQTQKYLFHLDLFNSLKLRLFLTWIYSRRSNSLARCVESVGARTYLQAPLCFFQSFF